MSDSDLKSVRLEIGGSAFELIEFALTRKVGEATLKGTYGVNVAKVREVVRMPKINPLASRVKGLAGIFELRGVPIPAVNLPVVLGDDNAEPQPTQQVIVTEFSQKRAGFIVDQTRRIRRVAWDKVLPPSADHGSFMSGMTLLDDGEFLFILDLERILLTLEHASSQQLNGFQPPAAHGLPSYMIPSTPLTSVASIASVSPDAAMVGGKQGEPMARLLVVEDSLVIRNGMREALLRRGYDIVEATDGVDAWNLLEETLSGRTRAFDLVITDVEMPRMDGLSLTRKIRDHASLRTLPVLLHTSLSGHANQQAGLVVGANGYVIKNDFRTLFELIHEILGIHGNAAVGA